MNVLTIDSTLAPSRMVPYNTKTFEVRPLGPKELTLLSRSAVTDSIEPMIEAVSACMGIDANELTVGDYYYVVSWLRFNSLKKSPPFANWDCAGHVFLHEKGSRDHDGTKYFTQSDLEEAQKLVDTFKEQGKELPEDAVIPDDIEVEPMLCAQHNELPLSFTDLRVFRLGDEELDSRLDYPRVASLPSYLEALANPDFAKIAPAAQWLKAGNTVLDKISILMDEPDLDLYDLCSITQDNVLHGVSNYVKKACSKCGTTSLHTIDFSASQFFRE